MILLSVGLLLQSVAVWMIISRMVKLEKRVDTLQETVSKLELAGGKK